MKSMALCASLVGACAVAGCSLAQNQADPRSVGIRGVPATLAQTTIVTNAAAQETLVGVLIQKAYVGIPPLGADDARWKIVAEAGIAEVDMLCDQYISALYAFNRDQQSARQGLTAASATTAAILGLTGAAGVTVALVAAAFGLGASLFDAGVNSVLFSVSPDAVRSIAQRGRQAYLAGIVWKDVTTRPRMMIVVQGYLTQCSPSAIEANINNAATGAPSVASSSADIALKAAAMAAPSSTFVQNPEVLISRPVTDKPSELRLTVPEPAPNLTELERQTITTRDQVRSLQRALGVNADGDLGPFDAGKLPDQLVGSRLAVEEFQAGVIRQNDPRSVAPGTSQVDGGTFIRLRRAGGMPDVLKSSFERGLLGNGPDGFRSLDPEQVEKAIRRLDPSIPSTPATTPEALTDRLNVLRKVVATTRAKTGAPAARGKPEALDSALYDFVKPPASQFPQPGATPAPAPVPTPTPTPAPR